MATAEIVSIGSELLLGQIVDTNASWMAQRLTDLGVNLFYKSVVGDNPDRMAEVIERALERADIVITGGGLGPTQDDLTREIVARVTGRELIRDPRLAEQIETRFHRRGMIMTENNMRQAWVPEGSITVDNPNGTAPSFIVEDPRGVIFTLPGVPFEMKWLFDNEVAPYLQRKFELTETITYRVLKVAELGESRVDDLMGHLIANSTNPTVGVLAHPGQVDVRIAAKAANVDDAQKLIEPVDREVRRLLGQHVFAMDDRTMEDSVGELLASRHATIAVFEDLTGGMLADRLQRSGEDRFVEGIVANGTASIRRLLAHGDGPSIAADSDDHAALTEALAFAVRSMAGADHGVALHAVPAPEERAENLARGQTFISVTDGESAKSRSYNYGGRGRPDQTRMSFNAMELVRITLLEGS
ncbi:MAG: CinA family nicotinamide mononucleotide deamidase-related protein [SAR202 cluster bacterium]|nr:CinA family nicotinamide mononucleotide deamidase-related protein [SAR202 cluster bacterium]MDP6301631.1 CinA family nicotinamide mononucleotide deamidase-related protein [SAR202 cluster bacterium]MDP7102503.1 CinA family nicotinamide mononucleotide deamidase-related protein [SAR202 cluster bacterium]MDP7223833.1 CinA family nicotinamide mononucleotide deamidase-related protein [SAR202 cluster bacterium]HJO82668.1 CinA family nicotinamide mononucleotide deamidase-related protein [SAR202 clus